MNKLTNTNKLDVVDAINHRLTKLRSITSIMLSSNCDATQTNPQHLYGIFWTMDDFLEEIEKLSEQL